MTTYSSKSNAIRAARAALRDKVADAMSGVHFRVEEIEGGQWTWREIDVVTGELVSGETEEAGTAPTRAEIDAALVAHRPDGEVINSLPQVPGPERTETREQRRLRLIREADERNKAGVPHPKGKAASGPKAGGAVATKVAELIRLVQSPEGLTETQLKEITGWTKFGGFYAAVKQAGLTMTRTKVDGVNVWRAEAPVAA